MRNHVVAGVLLFVLADVNRAQPAGRPDEAARLQKRIEEVETLLQKYHELFSRFPDLASRRKRILERAAKSELEVTVETVAGGRLRPGVAGPEPIAVDRLTVSGTGFFPDIMRLVRHQWIEGLQLRPAPLGKTAFEARLAYLRATADEFPPIAGSDVEKLRAAYEERVNIFDAVNRASAASAASESMVAAAATVAATLDRYPVSLTAAELRTAPDGGGTVVMEGHALGETGRRGVLASLAEGGLPSDAVKLEPSGRCGRFRLTATILRPDLSEHRSPPLPAMPVYQVFDPYAEAWCAAAPTPRLPPISAGAGEPGAVPMIRLRNADLDGVFKVLGDLGEGFIVLPEVRGRVDVDLHAGIPVDEIYAKLAAAGAPAGPGPVRVVGPAEFHGHDAERQFSGEPVTMHVVNARITDILCSTGKAFTREVRVPPGLRRRLSVYVTDQPLDLLLDRLATAAGLVHRDDGKRLDFEPRPGSGAPKTERVDPCGSLADEQTRIFDKILSVADLVAADFQLAGLVRGADHWVAYAALPGNGLVQVREGDALADGKVIHVGEDGVAILVGGTERVEVKLGPPRRALSRLLTIRQPEEPMARNKDRENSGEIDAQKAGEENASPKELREINEGRGDGGNPEWWRNDGRSPGEVH